jgi:hypothetical protein
MRFDIDEARRHGEPGHVDLATGGPWRIAEGGNAAIGNGEIAALSGTAAAVVEHAAAQK